MQPNLNIVYTSAARYKVIENKTICIFRDRSDF